MLADGTVWDGLRGLRKDNRGYDMKHVFIGAEGTLGIITGAVLKLFPAPREHHTAFVAMRDLDAVLALLSRARQASADTVTAFELIPRRGLEFRLPPTSTASPTRWRAPPRTTCWSSSPPAKPAPASARRWSACWPMLWRPA